MTTPLYTALQTFSDSAFEISDPDLKLSPARTSFLIEAAQSRSEIRDLRS
jgi:hypothetical protein